MLETPENIRKNNKRKYFTCSSIPHCFHLTFWSLLICIQLYKSCMWHMIFSTFFMYCVFPMYLQVLLYTLIVAFCALLLFLFHLFVCWFKFDTFFFLYNISSDSILRLNSIVSWLSIYHSKLPFNRISLIFADGGNVWVHSFHYTFASTEYCQ